MGLFSSIRRDCAQVAALSKSVRIHPPGLESLADRLVVGVPEPLRLDPAHHRLADPASSVAFIVTLDAINFGSGWFPHLKKRPGCSGYFTIAGALEDYFAEHGPLQASDLSTLTKEDCVHIFAQDPASLPIAELMDLFAMALRDLGAFIEERFHGSFMALVESANHSAEALVEKLVAMPLYQDKTPYGKMEVAFYKRAQLTCSDLDLAFGGEGFAHFVDLCELTLFADNLIPHVLRVEGALRYAPTLLARIEAGGLIPWGSAEEVEIRAVALHAVELLKAHMRERGQKVSARDLDHLLWNRGQHPEIKAERRHRTRCPFY